MNELIFKFCSFLIKSENSGDEDVCKRLLNINLPLGFFDSLDRKTLKLEPTLQTVVFDDCFDFYKKYGKIPTKTTVISWAESNPDYSREQKREYVDFVENCCAFPGDPSELNYYLDSLYQEYLQTYITKVSSKAISLLDEGPEKSLEFLKQNTASVQATVQTTIERSNEVSSLTDIFQDLLTLYQEGKKIQPIKSYFGFSSFDKTLGGFPSQELTLLAGRPSVGKSFLASEIAYHNAIVLKKNVVYSTNEVSKNQMEIRLLSRLTGIPSEKIRKNELDEVETELIQKYLLEYISDGLDNFLIIPPTHARTVESIRIHSEAHFKDSKIDQHIVDHINKLHSTQSEWRAMEDNGAKLKDLAQDHDCPVISPTHVSREGAKAERLTEQDIQYQALVQIADNIFGINPHPDYPALPPTEGSYEGTPGIVIVELLRSRTWPKGFEKYLMTKFSTASVCELSHSQLLKILNEEAKKGDPEVEDTMIDDEEFMSFYGETT